MESLLCFGYEDQRFENVVDDDFHCAICMNVLKDPVMCQNNQHYFCTACITSHLVQSKMCPTCREELNVETLRKPPRILTNFLSNLNIRCENYERGCLGFVKLGDIENHAVNCGFVPVKCSNDGCSIEVNRRDRIYHETEVCEFRKVKCHDCVEVKKDCAEMKRNYTEMKKDIEQVKNDVKQIKDSQNQMMKELMSLAGMMVQSLQINEATNKVEPTVAICASPPGPSTSVNTREDIIIAGGRGLAAGSSVEMFSWLTKMWVRLKSMKKNRASLVSFVHQNTMVVAGGYGRNVLPDDSDMEQMVLNDDQEKQNWLYFPAKLPKNLRNYMCVNFNDRLIVIGGWIQSQHSDVIYEVLLHPPYTVKLLTRLLQPRSDHGAERFNEDILIIGGETSDGPCDSVVLYDVNRNVCKQMPPLPYPVCEMATVTYGEFIVLVGGRNSSCDALNTVSMYNMRNGRSKMLPSMKHKRDGCTAVVTENILVVMGGLDDTGEELNSVECYSFDTNTWEELPPMNECRCEATSAVKTVN